MAPSLLSLGFAMKTTPYSAADVARQLANVVAIPLGILASYLVGPITGHDVGAVARQNEPLLAASSWTFAIWGVIFLGQLGYLAYQALPSHGTRPVLRAIGWLTAWSSVLTAAWVFVFVQGWIVASWAIILAILATQIAIEVRRGDSARVGPELVLVRIPYSLNLGWVSVATILQTTQVLDRVVQWDGGPLAPASWGVVMVAVATMLAGAMIALRPNFAFGVAVAWGLAGIFDYERVRAPMISGAALLGVIAVTIFCIAEIVVLATRSRSGKGGLRDDGREGTGRPSLGF